MHTLFFLLATLGPLPLDADLPVSVADLDRFLAYYDRDAIRNALHLIAYQRIYAEWQVRFHPAQRPYWDDQVTALNGLYLTWDALDWAVIRRGQKDDEGVEAWLGVLRARLGAARYEAGVMPPPWVEGVVRADVAP